jgi:hypothetical protein
MAMLVGLIALTGTDFSRHLPQMSGKTVFNSLPEIWGTLMACFDTGRGELRVDEATDLLVLQLYRAKFHTHTKAWGPIASLGGLLTELHRASRLSDRVKKTLPTVERITCTVRNANWVLAYWGGCGDHGVDPPNPVQPAYGFRQLANGATDYADLCCC